MSSLAIWPGLDILDGVVGESERGDVRPLNTLLDLKLIVTLLDVGSGMILLEMVRVGVCGRAGPMSMWTAVLLSFGGVS